MKKTSFTLLSPVAALMLVPSVGCSQNSSPPQPQAEPVALISANTTPGGQLLSFDFNANAWSKASSSGIMGGTTARSTRDDDGTIDSYKGQPSGAMSLTADFSKATQNAKAGLASGPLSVKNAERNLAKLTLGFDTWMSDLHPVRVIVQSLDAGGKVTGSRFATVLPPVKAAWYRFSLDLGKTQTGAGNFDPTAPQMQIVWELNDADGKVTRKANHVLRVDNVTLASPTLYVSPQGSDSANGRTEATAFATVQKAVDAAKPGDVISLMDGTHTGANSVAAIRKSGTPAAYITLRANPGANPVLRTRGWDVIKIDQTSAYWELRGLTIQGYRPEIELEAATVDGETKEKDGKKYPGSGFFNGNGISIEGRQSQETARPHHIRILENRVFDNAGGGISAINCDYITVENNRVSNNCHFMRYGGSGISFLRTWNFDDNTGYKMFVVGNISNGNRTFVPWSQIGKISDGNGIIIDDNVGSQAGAAQVAYNGRTLVQNNLCYGNGGSGIHAYASAHVDIVNNTAYRNAQSPELMWSPIFAGGKCDDVRIFNNILYAPVGKPLDLSVPKSSSRILYADNLLFGDGRNNVQSGGGLGTEAGGTASGLGSNRQGNPQFVKASLGDDADFRLQADSPAIDAAKMTHPAAPLQDLLGAKRPQGAAPDLGAIEVTANAGGTPVRGLYAVAVPKGAQLASIAPTGNSLIVNGNFANRAQGWNVRAQGKLPLQAEYVAGPQAGGKALRVTVAEEPNMKPYFVQATQPLFRAVAPNEKVTVRFMARSPQSNPIAVSVQQPVKPYRNAFYKQFTLTPEWKTYEATGASVEAFAQGDVGVDFYLASAPGVIEIADVQVTGKP